MYMMNQHDHEKVMELLLNEDPREAISFLQAKADEQGALRAEHDGTITCAHAAYVDDDCEIDDLPVLSIADKGVWVSAWVWVPIEDEEEELDEWEAKRVRDIANAFSRKLYVQLGATAMGIIIDRNADERDPAVCHSHDFADANVVMAEAFSEVMRYDADMRDTDDTDLWDAAWKLAKRSKFEEVKDAEA